MKKAILKLSDGTIFQGYSFGADTPTCGEVVFNTAMVGYPESLTDPNYAGQILTLTYPLIGNYGVPDTANVQANGLSTYMESDRIQVRALICTEYSEQYSHWNAHETLSDWLRRENIPAITGIDTRTLAIHLRDHGVMMGTIEIEGCEPPLQAPYAGVNWAAEVSCRNVIRYNQGANRKIVLLDCGTKNSLIRCLINLDVEVIRVPWDYDFNTLECDGLVISDGPGDPTTCIQTIKRIHTFMATGKPIAGIGLGHQLLALTAGGKTYKLPFGHHSHNQPVHIVDTPRCLITRQNHGYAVEADSLSEDWQTTMLNMNDHSIEAIRHRTQPWLGIQFWCADSIIQLLNPNQL